MSVSCITSADAFLGRNNIMFVILVYSRLLYTTGNKKVLSESARCKHKTFGPPTRPLKHNFLNDVNDI